MKLKDKKIELLEQVTTRDDEGFSTTALESVGSPVWAYFRQLSGKEVFAAATTNYKEEVLFVVNYRTDLTTAHVVRYKGILYDITRIDTFEGYKEDLTLYCSRRARQS
jgi:SPP1 family predicted phage head-tail adaptor